jgi:hypothetical protein
VTPVRRIAGVLLAGALVAGCGGTGDAAPTTAPRPTTGPALLIATRAASSAESDVTITGTLGVESVQTKQDAAQAYSLNKGGAKARAVVGEGEDSFEVVTSPGFIFVKGSEEFWAALVGEQNAKQVEGRWLVAPEQGALQDFAQFTSVERLFRSSGNVTIGKDATVDGTAATTLVDPPEFTDSTWWVQEEGEPLTIKYSSGKFTRLDLSYDETNIIDLPTRENSVDFTLVQNGQAGATEAPTAGG